VTEKAEKAWKVVAWFVVAIIMAVGTYAALVSAGVIDNPRANKTEPSTVPTTSSRTGVDVPTVGDTMRFGQYDWRVLDVQGGKALLLSEDIIEERAYNEELKDVTWETCTLREYLNGAFYNTFTLADRQRIVKSTLHNPDNNWGRTGGKPFGTKGGNETEDYIFLLSVQDLHDYFGGLKLYKDDDEREWYYEADDRLVAKFNGEAAWWWLRSPGFFQFYAACVNSDVTVLLEGIIVFREFGGVRPALWLNL
jgi:hypothetical protein